MGIHNSHMRWAPTVVTTQRDNPKWAGTRGPQSKDKRQWLAGWW